MKDYDPHGFMRGLLPLFVLTRCSESPASGKAIALSAISITNGKWKPSPGTLYPLLRQLEGKGLLKAKLGATAGRREIAYATTAKGKKSLDGHKKVLLGCIDEFILVTRPVLVKIVHGLDDARVREYSSDGEDVSKFIRKTVNIRGGRRA